MLSNPLSRRSRLPARKDSDLVLPFLERYRDKIAHIPKEGPMHTIITETASLRHSKATSKRVLGKENCSEGINQRPAEKGKGLKERRMVTEEKDEAMCIKLNPSGFQNVLKSLELPPLSNKGKSLEQCKYMMIVLKE
jgi:hypothetical protein